MNKPYQQHLSCELQSLPSTLPWQKTNLKDNFITMFFQCSLELNKLNWRSNAKLKGEGIIFTCQKTQQGL